MMRFVIFSLFTLFLSAPSFAKGHGGGHGGHSGGHSGGHAGAAHATGGAHASAGHGVSGAHAAPAHSGGGHSFSGHTGAGGFHTPVHAAPHMTSTSIIHRATSTAAVMANHPRTPRTYPAYIAVPPRNDKKVDNVLPVYTGFGFYSPLYATPFYYDPYFSLWSFGFNLAFSPNYGFGSSRPADDYYYDNEITDDSLEGYVVYAHDTLSGVVTIGSSAVFLETADSVQNYDYKFRMRKKELEYVVAFNADNKQVKMVRLPMNKNTMWRVVHEGKLNLYDDGKGLIYQPEDIDKLGLMARYNGKMTKLSGISQVKAKEQLIKCVNEAYGINLDPRSTSWNGLLIYLDKLDQ